MRPNDRWIRCVASAWFLALGLTAFAGNCVLAQEGNQAAPEKAGASEDDNYLGWSGEPSLGIRYWSVDGDEARFRQNHQQADGLNGGIMPSKFSYKRDDGLLFRSELLVDVPNDYRLEAEISKEGAGWGRLEMDWARYYYDGQFLDTLYYPQTGTQVLPTYRVVDPGDLQLDDAGLNFEVGLALEDAPKIWIGYETDSHEGKTSTYEWGITIDSGNSMEYGSIPGYYLVDLQSHRIYGGISHKFGDWEVSVLPEYEMVRGDRRTDETFYSSTQAFVHVQSFDWIYDHDTLQIQSVAHGPLVEDTLDLELGYVFANTNSDNNVKAKGLDAVGAATVNEKAFNFLNNDHDGSQYRHRWYMELTWEATDWLTAWAGFQYRTGSADSSSTREEDGQQRDGGASIQPNGQLDEAWLFDTNNQESGFAESVGFEIRKIPDTKVVLRGEFEQIDVDYDWTSDMVYNLATVGEGLGDWSWDDTGHYDRYSGSIRATTNWCEDLESTLYYRYTFRDVNHDEDTDIATRKDPPGATTDPDYTVGTAWLDWYYPGTISDTEIDLHETKVSLKWQAMDWIEVVPRYGYMNRSTDVNHLPEPVVSSYHQSLYGLNLKFFTTEELTAITDVSVLDGESWTQASRAGASIRRNPGSGAADLTWFGGLTDPIEHNYLTLSDTIEYHSGAWKLTGTYSFARQESTYKSYTHFGGLKIGYEFGKNCGIEGTAGYEDYEENQSHEINDYDAWLGGATFTGKF